MWVRLFTPTKLQPDSTANNRLDNSWLLDLGRSRVLLGAQILAQQRLSMGYTLGSS